MVPIGEGGTVDAYDEGGLSMSWKTNEEHIEYRRKAFREIMSKKILDNKLVRSVNKNIRSSNRKLKPILKSIVGKKVDIAIRDLSFSDKRISRDVKKTISSAVANAENNFQYDIDNLIVKEAYCGKQIVMKRFRPRAKGRAAPIIKPYSNLTIILSEKTKEIKHGTKS